MVGPAVTIFSVMAGWTLMRSDRRLAIYLSLAAGVPILAMACISLGSYTGLRYSFVSLYAWLALCAIGAVELYRLIRPRMGAIIAMAPLALIMIAMMLTNLGYFSTGTGFHPRWREAIAYVAEHRQATDLVAVYPLMGRYYLETQDVRFLPETPEELDSFGRTTWLITRAKQPIEGRSQQWLDQVADLRAYFEQRIVQPSTTLHVYRYTPTVEVTTDPSPRREHSLDAP